MFTCVFLTPSQGNDAQEQETLLLREAERGSSAMVVMPVNTQALSELLEQEHLLIPLISLKSQIKGTAGGVHLDNAMVGTLLAEAALEDENVESMILLNLTPENSGIALRLSEAQKALEQAGVTVQVCDKERLEPLLSEGSTAAVLCFEPYATLYAANLTDGSGETVPLRCWNKQPHYRSIRAWNSASIGRLK